MSREIITVKGAVDPDRIGACQFHEHILMSKGVSYDINPALYMESVKLSSAEVSVFKASGGTTIIDAQPTFCNRVAMGLKKISENTNVNIICSTGFHKLIFYLEDHMIRNLSVDKLTDLFVKELTAEVKDEDDVGIFTGIRNESDFEISDDSEPIRAGIVKTALDTCNLTPEYERFFTAAAEAAIAADRVMMVHVEKGSDPLSLLDFLIKKGMNPRNLVFCHMDRMIPDLKIHEEIMSAGAYTESDTIGRFKYHSDETELDILKYYIEKGYEDKILISLDTTRARLKSYTPDSEVGLDYIFRCFIPQMLSFGISQDKIHKMLYENPVHALCGLK